METGQPEGSNSNNDSADLGQDQTVPDAGKTADEGVVPAVTRAMRPEIKAAWVAALRSGEYVQGTGRLGRRPAGGESEFCCLGVLCELAVGAGVITRLDRLVSYATGYSYAGHDADLPGVVIGWAWGDDDSEELGASARDPRVVFGDEIDPFETTVLSSLNDNGENSFAQIADVIEQSL